MKTAFETAKLYLTKLPIDPVTGAKMGVHNATSPFEFPENFRNTTSEDLKRWEAEGREYERLYQATPEEIEHDIGEQPAAPSTPSPEPEVVEQGKKKKKKEAPAPIPAPSHPEDEVPSALDVFSDTISGLIKIASELDAEGKEDAAEQVHRVIRKYQSRIL